MEEEYLEEACFYLSELEVDRKEIADQFNIRPDQVELAVIRFKQKIEGGQVNYDEETKNFWAKLHKESSGDEKITMVDDKGRYYHGWRSELDKLPTEKLVELLVINKQYSDKHPLSEFAKTQPALGYDPLIPLRNIRRAVSLIDEILQTRAKEEEEKNQSDKHQEGKEE